MATADGFAADEDLVVAMRDTMQHRGPDDGGAWTDGRVALAHRRLSIVDLSAETTDPVAFFLSAPHWYKPFGHRASSPFHKPTLSDYQPVALLDLG